MKFTSKFLKFLIEIIFFNILILGSFCLFFLFFFGLLMLSQYFVVIATGSFLKLYNVQLWIFDLIDLITSRNSILLAGLDFSL